MSYNMYVDGKLNKNVSTTSAIVDKLEKNTRYSFYVTETDGVDESQKSSTISILTNGSTEVIPTLKPDFTHFGLASSDDYVRLVIRDNLVELTGVAKNLKEIAKNDVAFMGSFPVKYAPKRRRMTLCQASGSQKYLLSIYPDGTFSLSRHGTGSATVCAVNSYLVVCDTWGI